MAITTVLFDLDGTLLPMDQDEFINNYFGKLARKMSSHGYDTKKLLDAVWAGTGAMVKNDGSVTNEAAFWNVFSTFFGDRATEDLYLFDEFYSRDFDSVKEVCSPDPRSRKTVELVKSLGLRAVLATNPLFPAVATKCRIRWAGLDYDDFELVTTYENCSYCKPSLGYYRQVIDQLGASSEECLMVGNDVEDDMVAESLGMKVFLLTDCLINSKGRDISTYPCGGFDELMSYIRALVD